MKRRLIESDAFPIEFLSKLAEAESWRKDIYRPIYHLHKWWAKRLGSVFRGIILGAVVDEDTLLQQAFYAKSASSRKIVLDPFMGSGTTIGEAHKLGCVALGKDINPVSCEAVRVALSQVDELSLHRAFVEIESKVSGRIRELYSATDSKGRQAQVLYYFWVKQADCPKCEASVDLFGSRIFSQNAYPKKRPEVQVCCPKCSGIFSSDFNREKDICPHCRMTFALFEGNVMRSSVRCNHCETEFKITDAIRRKDTPPHHRLYAKMLLTVNGEKEYCGATNEDTEIFSRAERVLEEELRNGRIKLPNAELEHGYNTKQAISYNYRNWRDFFNARQLLSLGWIQAAIAELGDAHSRDALMQLFSSVLEFNNLFASFKGEGTGAVRHMFSHHILKPERTPLEANPWGTEKSSGSFSNLFRIKFSRLIEYQSAPFEVGADGEKAFPGNIPFAGKVTAGWPANGKPERDSAIYIECGGSQTLGVPDKSVDLIVTDPPFFDNVHYSELADFFFAWQALYPHGFIGEKTGTRHRDEVQDADVAAFASKLESVYRECARVLKDDGIMVFSYHHSRAEGWESVARAVCGAGFSFVNAQPLKAEMSVATPKSQADEPIQLDTIFVCRKAVKENTIAVNVNRVVSSAMLVGELKENRLRAAGFALSTNDLRVIYCGQAIAAIGYSENVSVVDEVIREVTARLACKARPELAPITAIAANDRAVMAVGAGLRTSDFDFGPD